jgi:parvulin-like peptidyl-prolyl isomerase
VSRPLLRNLLLAAVAVALVYGAYRAGRAAGPRSPLDPKRDDGPVVARYAGRTLHLAEVQARVDALPEGIRARLDAAGAREELVNDMVRLELVARAAEERGHHRDPEFARRYAQELGQLHVRREVDERQKPVTDDEVRAWLDAHRGELARPERARVAVVSFLATDAAEREKKRAVASAALAEARRSAADHYAFGRIARERSDDLASKAQNGELPPATREELAAALGAEAAEAAFATAEAGRVADRVFESERGFHVLKVLGREAAYEPRLEELLEPLRGRIAAERRLAEVEQLSERIWTSADVRVDPAALSQLQAKKGKASAAAARR